MRRSVVLVLALVLLALVAPVAAADDDERRFRRTTPRAVLETEGGALVLGVPSGRAWGIESELRALPSDGALSVRIAVADEAVREAFVRIAYYASATGRPRQITIADSEAVDPGERRVIFVPLDPPAGAVAYRLRVLARLRAGAERSRPDGVRIRVTPADPSTPMRSVYTRLLPDRP